MTYHNSKLYETSEFWFFRKGTGNSNSIVFCVWFFKKKYFILRSIIWPNLICLIVFSSRDIGQYVYSNCLWTGCSVINFEINLIALIKPFFDMTENSKHKFKYYENEKSFSFQKFLRLESASLMLWNSISWSRLKLTVHIQLALHLCDPFLINNRNTTDSIVEKCFAEWNVIQGTLLTLKPNTYCFCRILCLIFAYPSNKRIIYGTELNL